MNTKIFLALAMTGTLLNCSGIDPVIISDDDPIGTDTSGVITTLDPAVIQPSLSSFSWALFQETLQEEDPGKNVMISPLSVAAAIYMAYNGADRETKTQMEQVLALNEISPAMLNAAFSTLIQLLSKQKDGTQLSSANAAFWDENRMIPSQDFLSQMKTFYDAELVTEDFRQNPEAALTAINSWVEEKTGGRIEKILEEIKEEEILFLVNALYFIGDWLQPFDPDQTRDAAFTKGNDTTIDVPMLFQDGGFSYHIAKDYSAVECQFADSTYSVWFVRPDAGQSVEQWVGEHSYEDVQKIFDEETRIGRIFLRLPKFELNYDVSLGDALKKMGMDIAFDPNRSDFTKLGSSPVGNIYISRVKHKTFFKLDEKGVEGAAVTAVGFGATSLPPSIDLDRPFLTLLVHRPTQTLVFAGRVEDPLE